MIENVLVTKEVNDNVGYLSLNGNRIVESWQYSTDGFRRVTVTKSTSKQREELVSKWAQRTDLAEVERTVGPPVVVLSPSMRYPLSKSVTYIGGSPSTISGGAIYFGQSQDKAAKVEFAEIVSLTLGNTDDVRVEWRDGKETAEKLLKNWRYGQHLGEQVEVNGFDPVTLESKWFPISGVKSIRFKSPTSIACENTQRHVFGSLPLSWKFCPLCGKPLGARTLSETEPADDAQSEKTAATDEQPTPAASAPAKKEAPPDDEIETKAAGMLSRAKALIDKNKSAAKKRLKDVVDKYPKSRAAQEAEEIIKNLD